VQGLLRHPALAAVVAARGLTTPSVFTHLEAGLGMLRAADVDPHAAVAIYYALLTYTLGFVAWEVPRVHRQPEAAYAQQWQDALASLPADMIAHGGRIVSITQGERRPVGEQLRDRQPRRRPA
jgi:Tetracyclin repressor-like, C-terminal domain